MRWTKFLWLLPAVLLLSALLADRAAAQRPGGFGFGGFQQTDPISLLRSAGVREELEIEADQEKQIEAVRERMTAELDKSRREITAKYQGEVDKVLQPQQAERLQQISLQLRGVAALTETEVAKKLGLSDDQTKKIASAREEGLKKMQEVQGGFSQEARDERQKITEEMNKAMLGVLSASQQEQFTALKGKEIDRARLFGGRKKRNPDT